MINAAHRFHGHNSLRSVYKYGRTVRSPYLSVRYRASNRDGYRAAVVVSRKVHKSAVKRNRIRRRIYAIVAEQAIGNYDVVFTVFDARLMDLTAMKLRKVVEGLLGQAQVLKSTPVKSSHAIVNNIQKEDER